MRLDAAKLKGCFGSWFLRRACYPKSKVFHHQGLPKNPPLGGFFVSVEQVTLDPKRSSIRLMGIFVKQAIWGRFRKRKIKHAKQVARVVAV